jgi:hypothetical protein
MHQGVPRIENGAYTQYVSISICGATQPWALRRIFEIGSSLFRATASDPAVCHDAGSRNKVWDH